VKDLVFSHQDLLCGNILFNPDWCVRHCIRQSIDRSSIDQSIGPTIDQVFGILRRSSFITKAAAFPFPPPRHRSPRRVQFIDFEYGGYNHRGFDIGNHFCEYAGCVAWCVWPGRRCFDMLSRLTHTYTHTHTHRSNPIADPVPLYAHRFEPDYEKSYPGKPQQLHFLRHYVKALQDGGHLADLGSWRVCMYGCGGARTALDRSMTTDGNQTGTEDPELFLEELYVVANRYACAAHLFWGYWAIIQVRAYIKEQGNHHWPRGQERGQPCVTPRIIIYMRPPLLPSHPSPPPPLDQAKYSPIDFDFLLYASQRLDGYRAFKAKFF
jgi:thiamine kinase-like enzyme